MVLKGFASKKIIGMAKGLMYFVRDSPKRIAQFKDLQTEAARKHNNALPSLAAYRPTSYILLTKYGEDYVHNYFYFTNGLYTTSL